MNLIVDIGNSSAKAAVFDGDNMVMRKRLGDDLANNIAMIADEYKIDACAFSSVGRPRPEVADAIRQLVPFTVQVTGCTPTPLQQPACRHRVFRARRSRTQVGWGCNP